MGITRWSNRYQSRKDSQAALRLRLRELAGSRVRYGYRRLTVLLRREGWAVNAKRVYRLYREEELQVRTTKADQTSTANSSGTTGSKSAESALEYGFCERSVCRWPLVSNSDGGGSIHTRMSLRSPRALTDRQKSGRATDRNRCLRGAPESITSDNGSEFVGKAMETWSYQTGVRLDLHVPIWCWTYVVPPRFCRGRGRSR